MSVASAVGDMYCQWDVHLVCSIDYERDKAIYAVHSPR